MGGDTEKETIISARVFVGNLSDYTTQGDLQTLFAEAGEVVEVFLPTDRATGRPRGFAFIEFGDDGQAAAAIEKFEGHELEGRKIRVTEAEDRRSGPPSGFSGGGGGGGGFGPPAAKNRPKPKGSRRNLRGRKRSL